MGEATQRGGIPITGYSPVPPPPPPIPPPETLIQPTTVVDPIASSPFPVAPPPPPQGYGGQPGQPSVYDQIFGLMNSPMVGQLLQRNWGLQPQQSPQQDQGGPPFPWQRPAWQREGFSNQQSYDNQSDWG